MSRKRKPPTTATQFCLSCCLTLGCWLLWIVLAVALAAQTYVAVVKDVPLPGFVLRKIEQQLAIANLEIQTGKAHFDPRGQVVFENVRLRPRAFDEPMAIIRYAYFRKSFWSMLAGQTVPDEIRVEGATLQLPAMLSPSGTAEPLVQDVAATLRFRDDLWYVEQLTFRLGSMPVTARGEITPPRRTGGAPALSMEELIVRFRQLGRQIALRLPHLRSCERPLVDIHFHSTASGGIQLAFEASADGVNQPGGQPVQIGPVTARGGWVWDQVKPRTLHATVAADWVEYRESFFSDRVQGDFVLFPGAESLTFERVRGEFAARSVKALGEQFDVPVLSGSYSWPDSAAEVNLGFGTYGQTLVLEGTADLKQKSSQVLLNGLVPPELVTGLLTRYGPKLESYFRFGDPVELHARARFDPGWKFAGLWTRVHGGRLDSRGVGITGTHGRIDVDAAGNFLAYDALLLCGENYARGSYWMNFESMEYRMLLTGQLRPPAISGWFRGDWWPEFWSNFAFPTVPPEADVDVQGNWREAWKTSYFGSTDAINPTVLGATFEKAHTRIFVRPQFDHVIELAVTRAGGAQRGSGWFKRFADTETHQMTALEYDLAANLDEQSYRKLGGATAKKLLDPWRFTTLPDIQFRGRTDFAPKGSTTRLSFSGKANGTAWFYNFPVDNLTTTGVLDGDDLTLHQIEFQVAGGQAWANASLKGNPAVLGFDASVKNADLVRTLRTIEEFDALNAGTKPEAMADKNMMKRASGGRLDVSLSAQGSPSDLTNLRGNGNMQLTGSELGEVHLFGVLSQVLSAVWLDFSSLKLDAARSSFQLRDGRMHFPDLKITGPSAVIDAQGDYLFKTKSLDFSARLKPYEEIHNPITALPGVIMNTLTRIFELKLTGPIKKPNWSVNIGGGGLRSSLQPSPLPPPATDPIKDLKEGKK